MPQIDIKLHAKRAHLSVRGAAEIELLLVILFILLPILFLVGGMSLLGPARLLAVFSAQREAYQGSTAGQVTATIKTSDIWLSQSNIQLDPGVDVLQTNANQLNEVNVILLVTNSVTKTVPTMRLAEKAQVATSAWAYSSWPNLQDAGVIEGWSTDYANESTAPYEYPNSLELQPAWPP